MKLEERTPTAALQAASAPSANGWVNRPFPAVPSDLRTQAQHLSLLGVDYLRTPTGDGGELYLTRFGLPFWNNLLPENWYEPDWFSVHRKRLQGTSAVYRVPTRRVQDRTLDLVVKFSRVGEVVPVDTLTVCRFINAEFNSPFEEFALLMELRRGRSGPRGIRILTQRPLAIYVPSKRLPLWQTGRSEHKIQAKIAQHPGVEIDILREYVLLFGWVKGLDAVETADYWRLDTQKREEFLSQTNSLVIHELAQKGYRVVDMKPQHIILRPRKNRALLRDRHRQIVYALVDYELLQRTPEHEQSVRNASRQFYLWHMARRFDSGGAQPMPSHLTAVNLLGVDYVFGQAESTGGWLWVVGKDPDLFNYFLPERWRRTPKKRLSTRNHVFFTRTKDNVNLVWKVSRMGELPHLAKPSAHQAAVAHGFNSPFEEFALALELTRAGVRTVYPRAIYMTGSQRGDLLGAPDERRYAALARLRTPAGEPVLHRDRDYITVWGFWNGPDELLAADDSRHYVAMNARQAQQRNLIQAATVKELLATKTGRLRRMGVEDLNPKPDHLLVSFEAEGDLLLDAQGKPDVRLCNFELLRRLPTDPVTAAGSLPA